MRFESQTRKKLGFRTRSLMVRGRAFPGPGTGPLSGPGRGFQKISGLRLLTGPGLHIQEQLEGLEMKIPR